MGKTWAAAFGLALLVSSMPSRAVTITVDTVVDESPTVVNGNCTFREALAAAESNTSSDACPAGSAGETDIIEFSVVGTPSSPAVIEVVADLPQISEPLSIVGPGADRLTISGESSFLPTYQLFRFLGSQISAKPYLLKGLTVLSGLADDAIFNNGGCVAVINVAQLTLDHVVVAGCQAANSGGAIHLSGGAGAFPSSLNLLWSDIFLNEAMGTRGGGINIAGVTDFNLENSSVSGNTVQGTSGGGIAFGNLNAFGAAGTSEVTIKRSTIANNTNYGAFGGGLFLRSLGAAEFINATISHSTITGNVASAVSGTPGLAEGAGIYASGDALSLSLTNTILARNLDIGGNPTPTQSDDLEVPLSNSPTVTTGGFNFIGIATDLGTSTPFTAAGMPNGNNDFIANTIAGLDPVLNSLGHYGGFSRSRAPVSQASPVVDQGKCTGEDFDQRGYGQFAAFRIVDVVSVTNLPAGDGCDIGAVEFAAISVSDYDGDGTVDDADAFPLDPAETMDTDADGIGNTADPDDDNDGIGDALDTDPLVPSNSCTGGDADDATMGEAVSADVTCAARLSIDVQGATEVTGTAGHLHLIAPLIRFQSGFKISVDGRLTVISGDPCPGCSAE